MCGATSVSGRPMPPRKTGKSIPEAMKKRRSTTLMNRQSIASIWRQIVEPGKLQECKRSDGCPCCGAKPIDVRPSRGEIVTGMISLCLLLGILSVVGSIAEQWVEEQGHHFFDYMAWRDPADSSYR